MKEKQLGLGTGIKKSIEKRKSPKKKKKEWNKWMKYVTKNGQKRG